MGVAVYTGWGSCESYSDVVEVAALDKSACSTCTGNSAAAETTTEGIVADQVSTDSSTKQSDKTFVVGLRADTGLYFPNHETLTLKNFRSETGLIDLAFSTHRLSADGFSHPIRVGLWVDVRGPAPSMSAAVETFGNVARGMAAILSVTANTSIQDPTADMAYETTEGSSHREYWSRNPPEHDFPSGFGRAIIPQLPEAMIRAYAEHRKQDRFHRAIVQYHHAIQNWEPGSEIASLTHIWIGMEALTTIVRTQLMNDLELNQDDLKRRYSDLLSSESGKKIELPDYNALDAEIRRRHLFQGDNSTYKLAKDARNGYEHSFNPLWKVRDQAVQALDRAAEYLRRGILDYSGIDSGTKGTLLNEYFRQPFDAMLRLSLNGELAGTPEALDRLDEYPDIQWGSEPLQKGVDEEGDAEIGFETRIAASDLPSGITFKPTGIDINASPAMTQGTAVLAGKSRSALSSQGSSSAWNEAMDSDRAVSTIRIGGEFDQPIRTKEEKAISFDALFEYHVETIPLPEPGVDPEEMLQLAERLRVSDASAGWELLCALPSSQDSTLRCVYRRASNS